MCRFCRRQLLVRRVDSDPSFARSVTVGGEWLPMRLAELVGTILRRTAQFLSARIFTSHWPRCDSECNPTLAVELCARVLLNGGVSVHELRIATKKSILHFALF